MAEAECVDCEEVITQPICPSCLEEEMREWLQETKPELLNELQDRACEMEMYRGEMKCILCDSPMDICTYCFTQHILQWIKQHPELVKEFVMFFNYDLHYHGYAKEILELV